MKAEIERRQSNLDRVEAFFRANPGVWLNARDFEGIGGRQAWRSRIAECRTKRHMHIDIRLEKNAANEVTGSFYRFVPYAPLGPDASQYRPQELPLLAGEKSGWQR